MIAGLVRAAMAPTTSPGTSVQDPATTVDGSVPQPVGEPASRIRIRPRELRKLRSLARNLEASPSQVTAAQILLKAAQGQTDEEIAQAVDASKEIVAAAILLFRRSRRVALGVDLSAIFAQSPSTLQREARPISLTSSVKRDLERIAHAQTSEQRMALRAKIVIKANLSLNNCQIADDLGIDVKTVRKWRGRFAALGIDGLYDLPRSGRPYVFDASVRNEVFTAVVGEPPEPFACWSLDLLSKHLVHYKLVASISIESISYWLRNADIKPHKVRGWLNSKDPQFREKRDRIAQLYRHPPKDGYLLSVDEKTSIPARERLRKDLPGGPGRRKRDEYEYIRHGTAHLLASFDVRTGQVVGEILSGKNDSDAFIRFLKKLMKLYPRRKLYLILDNGTTHRSKKTKKFFAANSRLIPVFTPTHASWLNQIEIWFSVLTRQALRGASFAGREKLVSRIEGYIEMHNREQALPYEWSTRGKPLTGATAKERRRNRSIPRGTPPAVRC